jgi:REP element-mobilizing transposase RayT
MGLSDLIESRMARPWRIEYEGALYHVFSRGNNQQDIFVSDDDRYLFLDTIGQMSERFDNEIFAYVLMSNHYHLLLRTPKANLSRSMQWLGTTYTRRFNLDHFQSGHLFQGRYKSILVENDAYLMQLACYIHNNPLRAGIVKRLIDYRWSSYPAYAYNRRHPKWLDKDLILSQIHGENKHRAYREKSQKYSDEHRRIWEDIRHGFIYGSQKFVDRIKNRYVDGEPDPAIPQQKSIIKDSDPVALLSKASKILRCDLERIKNSPRVSESDKTKRDILLYLLWQEGQYTNIQIGVLLGLTHSAVSRRVAITRKKMTLEQNFERQVKAIKSQIKP